MNDALFIIDKPPMPAPDDTGPYEMPNGPKPISAAIDERNGELIVAAHNATIATLTAALEEARGALEPFEEGSGYHCEAPERLRLLHCHELGAVRGLPRAFQNGFRPRPHRPRNHQRSDGEGGGMKKTLLIVLIGMAGGYFISNWIDYAVCNDLD